MRVFGLISGYVMARKSISLWPVMYRSWPVMYRWPAISALWEARSRFYEKSSSGEDVDKSISLWPVMYRSPAISALWEARSRFYEKSSSGEDVDANSNITATASVAITPAHRRTCIEYKFSDDYNLREQYRDPWNRIRIGKFFEDLDAFAGTISLKHCFCDYGSTRSMLVVTAAVDKIVLKKPLYIDRDLKMVGAVTWVGRSSMEIQIEVSQSTQDTSDPSEAIVLTANFTFVACDSKTGKPATLKPVSPETDQEKLLWKEAEERDKARKTRKEKTTAGSPNNPRLHATLAEGRVISDLPALADRDSIMRNNCLETSIICQPQQRNIYGQIFGGFLMHKAFELAFSTAYAFVGTAPVFVEMGHADFLLPVDVGNLLRFKSCVLYTDLENSTNIINVEVVAHVTRPELQSSEVILETEVGIVSNKFYFTFTRTPEVNSKPNKDLKCRPNNGGNTKGAQENEC